MPPNLLVAGEVAQLYSMGLLTYNTARQRMIDLGCDDQQIETLISAIYRRDKAAGTGQTDLETSCRHLLLAWDSFEEYASSKNATRNISVSRQELVEVIEPYLSVIRKLIGAPKQ